MQVRSISKPSLSAASCAHVVLAVAVDDDVVDALGEPPYASERGRCAGGCGRDTCAYVSLAVGVAVSLNDDILDAVGALSRASMCEETRSSDEPLCMQAQLEIFCLSF